jgi:hypothetical protein
VLANDGTTIDKMTNLFVSASLSAAKVYGLYAVPVNSSPTVIKGDTDSDGKVTCLDLVLMKNYVLGLNQQSKLNLSNADIDGNGKVNVIDITLLKKLLLSVSG